MLTVSRGIAVSKYTRGGKLLDQILNSISGVAAKQLTLASMPLSSKTNRSTCSTSPPATSRVASQAQTHCARRASSRSGDSRFASSMAPATTADAKSAQQDEPMSAWRSGFMSCWLRSKYRRWISEPHPLEPGHLRQPSSPPAAACGPIARGGRRRTRRARGEGNVRRETRRRLISTAL